MDSSTDVHMLYSTECDEARISFCSNGSTIWSICGRSRGRPLLFSLAQLLLKLLGTYISVAALLNILTFYTIESRGKTQVSCIWMCMTFLLKAKSRGSGKWHTDLAWSVGDAERLIFEEQHHPWRIWESSGIVLILINPCKMHIFDFA